MTAVIPRLVIGGKLVPTNGFTVTAGAYGSTGSLVSNVSGAALAAADVDLVALSIASPGSLPVDLYISGGGSVESSHLFSGEYLTGAYDYNADLISVHARDWSGPLVDQKRALTSILKGGGELAPEETNSGISTANQKMSQIVTQIAQQFSLTPDLRINQNISNADADYGAIFGDSTDTILTATPQTLWGVLTKLAKQTGNIVYVTPEKHLVFGEAGAGLDTLQFTWRQTVGGIPLLTLNVTHNPRRNLTFRVLVKSYDPTVQQLTSGQAYVIGTNFQSGDGSTIHGGAWNGAASAQIASSMGSDSKKIPIYTYHVDGLTASQAQSRAEAIAADIAKRELVVTGSTDLIADLEPGQQAKISGLINSEFAGHTYYMTSFHHRFSVGRDGPAGELITEFSMLDRQPEGQGKSVSPKPTKAG